MSGHGWVTPNANGVKARCGGPALCSTCQAERCAVIEKIRKAPDLDAAAKKPDGKYDGTRALSWLSEVLNPGRGFTPQEVKDKWEEIVARKRAERGH